MQDYNTIIGVIQLRQNQCSFSVIEARYHIGSGTVQRILNHFAASGMALDELRAMEPSAVEEMFYPPKNLQRKDIPLPDFQHYYDRIHEKEVRSTFPIARSNTAGNILTATGSPSSMNTSTGS